MWVPQYRGEVAEYAKASRILREFDFTGFRRKKAPLAVVLPDLSAEEGATYDLLDEMAWMRYSMLTGLDFDFVSSEPRPELVEERGAVVNVDDWPRHANIAGLPRSFETTSGWYIQYLISEDDSKALIYLANYSGAGLMPSNCWMRVKKPAQLSLHHMLKPGRYEVTVHDLDSGEELKLTVSSPGWLYIGRTGDDHVVRFARVGW